MKVVIIWFSKMSDADLLMKGERRQLFNSTVADGLPDMQGLALARFSARAAAKRSPE